MQTVPSYDEFRNPYLLQPSRAFSAHYPKIRHDQQFHARPSFEHPPRNPLRRTAWCTNSRFFVPYIAQAVAVWLFDKFYLVPKRTVTGLGMSELTKAKISLSLQLAVPCVTFKSRLRKFQRYSARWTCKKLLARIICLQ